MTTQTNPRARVNMMLSSVHNAAAGFFHSVSAMLMMALFLCGVAAFAIPIAHHVWNYWNVVAASLQSPAPVGKPATAAQKK